MASDVSPDEFHGLQLLRVKRRREDAAAEHLIIQSVSLAPAQEGTKRPRKATAEAANSTVAQHADQIARHLSSALDLSQQEGAAQQAAQDKAGAEEHDAAAADAIQKQVTRRRYVRVHTLHKDALQGVSAEDIRKLISTWRTAGQNGSVSSSSATATTTAPAPAPHPDTQQQQPKLHYKLLGSKRPSSKAFDDSQTGAVDVGRVHPPSTSATSAQPTPGTAQQSVDALGEVVKVVDLHAHHPDHAVKRQRGTSGPAAPAQPAARGEQQPAAQPAAGAAAQGTSAAGEIDLEALLKAHYLPLLNEVVTEAGYNIPMAQNTVPQQRPSQGDDDVAHTVQEHKQYKPPGVRRNRHAVHDTHVDHANAQQPPSADSTAAAGEQQQQQGAAGEMSEGESEMVYDVYVPVDEPLGEAGDDEYEHLAIPVIEVPDSDDELWWAVGEGGCADPGHDWLQHDSEDSNAESYYANTYPDEDDDRDEQYFDDDLWDGEGRSGRAGGGGWGDEEWDADEYDSSEEEEMRRTAGEDVVARSRLAAQAMLRAALAKHNKDTNAKTRSKAS